MVTVVRPDRVGRRPGRLVTEEPLEVRVVGLGQEPRSVAVIMRTPGNDFELAVGLLHSEGIITHSSQVSSVRYCQLESEPQMYNMVTVVLNSAFGAPLPRRASLASSSGGLCAKAVLDDVERSVTRVDSEFLIEPSVVSTLADALSQRQKAFDSTGAVHSAGLFDRSGLVDSVAEDVGRHNAVDKLFGRALLAQRLPLSQSVLMISGRLCFKIVHKAALAGIPVVCSVSVPSGLAVETGERLGVTVVGLVGDDGFNVYSHPERLVLSELVARS